jgi:hypothetical protein
MIYVRGLQILGSVSIVVIVWALYRLYKRWSRRCEHCGSMWHYERWHEREYVHPIDDKKCQAITTTYYVCYNQDCPFVGQEFSVKAYHKVFPLKKVTH